MIVQVGYVVPVEVCVDIETGLVDRVVVVDEEINLDRDDCVQDSRSIHATDYETVTDQAVRDLALKIAEDAEWPPWEHGF